MFWLAVIEIVVAASSTLSRETEKIENEKWGLLDKRIILPQLWESECGKTRRQPPVMHLNICLICALLMTHTVSSSTVYMEYLTV